MRILLLVLMSIFTILLGSSAFADTTSSPDKSTSKNEVGLSDAYYYAHAAGIMHSLVKSDARLTYADVVSLIKSK